MKMLIFFVVLLLPTAALSQSIDFDLSLESPDFAREWQNSAGANAEYFWGSQKSAQQPQLHWSQRNLYVGIPADQAGDMGFRAEVPTEIGVQYSDMNIDYWSTVNAESLRSHQYLEMEAMGLVGVQNKAGQNFLTYDGVIQRLIRQMREDCTQGALLFVDFNCAGEVGEFQWWSELCDGNEGQAIFGASFGCGNKAANGTAFIDIDCSECFGTGTVTVKPPELMIFQGSTEVAYARYAGAGTSAAGGDKHESGYEYSLHFLHQLIVHSLIERWS